MKKKIAPVFFFLMCFIGHAQILTFDFNGLSGNEASAVSNSNDANASSSTITRGSGLTASNNGNRFNATSWATSSIANAVSGNDYMEFTFTPNSGFDFNVTTMVFNVQRSGTGLSAISLRSSLDSYAANIDAEMAIADNTSTQVITFTVSQTGNSAAVTYRIYGFSESTGGSGGFEGSGNDIIVNGSVVSSCTDAVDTANIQSPTSSPQTITVGDMFNVTAQTFESGVTEAAGAGAGIEAWIGYNTTDNDPSVGAGWTWVAATFNTQSGTNDEFIAEIGSGLAIGTYYYASRFRLNSCNFTYGGTGGVWSSDSVQLDVNAPPTADVVITEIMYNTSGTDDEWIEICNVSGSTQNLSSYIIDVGGVTEHTFGGSTTLADGACITISLGSNGDGTYNPGCNFTPDEGEDASTNSTNNLVNSTDTITLFAADGTTVADVVTYASGDGANGNDASLHVVDITMNNSDTGTNWQEVTIGGSPGTNALLSPCASTQVEFVATTSTLAEDGAFIDICVSIVNPSGSTATTVEVALDGGSTATNGTDYDDGAGTPAAISFPVTLTFPAGSSANQCVTIYISNDDAVTEPSETVILNLQNVSGGTTPSIGTNSTHTLTITDNDGAGSSDIMITQYYEGASNNKWVEVKNVSGSIIPANTYYIAVLNNADADTPASADPSNGSSPSFNNNVLIATDMAVDEVRRYREDSAVLPAYASPGETGYDGNPTFDFPSTASLFSGDDIVLISTSIDSNIWTNRVDVIGDGTTWGDRRCFVRNSCVSSGPSTTFDINDWVEFTDTEVENSVSGTNPYLGEHEEGVTIWNGSAWSNGTPDRSRIVTLSGNYNTTTNGNLTICSLTVDSGVTTTIPAGTYIDIENDLTVNNTGILNINHEGSLVMVDDTGIVTLNGTGIVNVEKTTTSFEQYDYTYWSSPVASTTFGTAIGTWRLDRTFSYVASNFEDLDNDEFDDNDDVWSHILTGDTMTPGVGYAAMGPTTGSFPRTENVTFSGAVNNGVITSPISLSADASDADDDWNFVGNPYPSAISADDFVTLNTNITGTLYLWTHIDDVSISNPGPDLFNYSTDDYAMYNASGGVGTGSTSGSTAPTGFIASGQGFFIEAITAGTVTFNNSMRSNAHANTNFYRPNNAESTTDSTEERDRIWLNLTNADGAFSQLLIGFFEDATLQKDRLYDGIRLNGSNYLRFYSKDDTHQYGIQGRPAFVDTDIVPLGYDSAILGDITVSIDQIEGILNTPDVEVYLKDLELNITHDLKLAPYTFETTDGIFSNRFQLQFINNAILNVEEEVIAEDALAVYLNNNKEIEIKQRTRTIINSVNVYSMLGQLIGAITDMNQKVSLREQASGVYLVVINTEKGSLTKKITR